jgi:hypothetical protein
MTHGAFLKKNERNAKDNDEPLGLLLSSTPNEKNQETTMSLLAHSHFLQQTKNTKR